MEGQVPRARGSFTLMELLVVIAAICVLAAMLLPVLGRARETAKKTKCKHNLYQLSTAVLQYAQEEGHGQYFPVGTPFEATYRIQALPAGQPVRVYHGLLYGNDPTFRIVWSPSVFGCPSASVTIVEADFKRALVLDSSYWWINGDHVDPAAQSKISLKTTDELSRFPFFWDRHENHKKGAVISFEDAHAEWRVGDFGPNTQIGETDKIQEMIRSILAAQQNIR